MFSQSQASKYFKEHCNSQFSKMLGSSNNNILQDLHMNSACQYFGLVRKGNSYYKDGNRLGGRRMSVYRRRAKGHNFWPLYSGCRSIEEQQRIMDDGADTMRYSGHIGLDLAKRPDYGVIAIKCRAD